MGDDATAVVMGCEWDFGDAGAGDSGDAVVANEALIEHTELGVDDVSDTEVGVDHLADEGAGFMEHGVLENDLELRVEWVSGVAKSMSLRLSQLSEKFRTKVERGLFRRRSVCWRRTFGSERFPFFRGGEEGLIGRTTP